MTTPNEENQIIAMLTLVLERQTSLETKSDAIHNALVGLMGDVTKQGWDISKIKTTLYGPDGEGGGLVAQVEQLRLYGTRLPPWLVWATVAALAVLTVASICVIALTWVAARTALGG